MQQPESRLQRRIRGDLEKAFPGSWWLKVHGGIFQPAGIPDLIGCVAGFFFSFEVKMPRGKVSNVQVATLRRIHRSGGVALVVTNSCQAIDAVNEVIHDK